MCTCRPDVVRLLHHDAAIAFFRCLPFNHLCVPRIMQNGQATNHDERTPLLSATYGNNEGVHQSLSARRRSLNAIAAGSQSEFGGANQGLENFRQIVARNRLLSNAEQDEAVIDQVRQLAGQVCQSKGRRQWRTSEMLMFPFSTPSRAGLSFLQSGLTTLQAYEKLVFWLHGWVSCLPH